MTEILKVTSLYDIKTRICNKHSYIINKWEWRDSDNIQNVLLQYWSENSLEVWCGRVALSRIFLRLLRFCPVSNTAPLLHLHAPLPVRTKDEP